VLWFYDYLVELKLNKVLFVYIIVLTFKYNAPTALGIQQEIKQTMANVFHLF